MNTMEARNTLDQYRLCPDVNIIRLTVSHFVLCFSLFCTNLSASDTVTASTTLTKMAETTLGISAFPDGDERLRLLSLRR